MRTLVLGNGPMGRALAAALAEAGHEVASLGRPIDGRHPTSSFADVEVVFDFSTGLAVAGNVEQALDGGCRRLVIGATGWHGDRPAVERLLRAQRAAGVAAANFSPGVALFGRLVVEAARLFGPLAAYDPFIVEWHRASKLDRPSGTARELSRRLTAAHPRKRRTRDPRRHGPTAPDELEVVSLRAGASPGMHLVGFDAPGETLKLRLTARDRSAYAAGAVAAAEWLLAARRSPGLHPFDAVLSDLTDATATGSA